MNIYTEPSIVNHRNHTSFCDEKNGPCETDDDDDDDGSNQEIQAQLADQERIKADEESLLELLAEVKFYLVKEKPLTKVEEDEANLDVDKIAFFAHDIASIAGGRAASTAYNDTNSSSVLSSENASQEQLVANERFIAERMNEDPSLDVSVLGNSAKETGHQMGKIAAELAQSGQSDEDQAVKLPSTGETSEATTSAAYTGSHNNASENISSASNEDLFRVEKIDLSLINLLNQGNQANMYNNQGKNDQKIHKQRFLKLIEPLRITGDREEDRIRVAKIAKIMEDIEKEQIHMQILEQRLNEENSYNEKQRLNDEIGKPHHQLQQQQPQQRIVQYQTQLPLRVMIPNDKLEELRKDEAPQGPHLPNSPSKKEDTLALSSPADATNNIIPEVNFNGGFPDSIDELKQKYPQGRWPEEVKSDLLASNNMAQRIENIIIAQPTSRSAKRKNDEGASQILPNVYGMNEKSSFKDEAAKPRRRLPINIIFHDYDDNSDKLEGIENGGRGYGHSNVHNMNQPTPYHLYQGQAVGQREFRRKMGGGIRTHGGISKREERVNHPRNELSPEYLENLIANEHRNSKKKGQNRNHQIQAHGRYINRMHHIRSNQINRLN